MSQTQTVLTPASDDAATNPAKIISLQGYSDKQKSAVKRIVAILDGRENISVKFDTARVSANADTPQMYRALVETLNEILPRVKKDEEFSTSQIKTAFRNNYTRATREMDPKVKARQETKAARDDAERRTREEKNRPPEPLTMVVEEITADQMPQADRLARILNKSARSAAAVQEMKSFFRSEIYQEGGKLKIMCPHFEDASLTEEARTRILKIAAYLVSEITSGQRHFTHALVKKAIAATEPKKSENTFAPFAKSASKSDAHPILKVTEVGGRKIGEWANAVVQAGRAATLQAFGANPDLGFAVTPSKTNGDIDGLNVRFAKPGTIDTQTVKIALYVIGEVQGRWAKTPNANKAMVGEWLKDIWKDINHCSDVEHGDHLKLVFEKRAAVTPQVTILNTSFKDATSAVTKGDITPKMNFEVPSFNKDGVMVLTHESGRKEELIPTSNQSRLMNAVRASDFSYVVCQGPVGAGKTMWVCYAALQLLQQGHVFKIFYDRPLEGTGGKSIGYLKGDLEDKMGPFHDTFEKNFAKILGKGNIASGREKLKALKEAGVIERYDEIFKRGDTVEDALLIVDEAQNKTRDEIYHLLTRTDSNSKLILMGDGEFQVDLRHKGSSGFLEMADIYGCVDRFAFVPLDETDIKRSETVQKVYLARRDWEKRQQADREATSGTRQNVRLPEPAQPVSLPAPAAS